jgi:hypothetical protein
MKSLLVHLHRNLVAYVALVVALAAAPTSAYAVATIRSSDIVDGQVKAPDLAKSSVRSAMVLDDSLAGADVATDSLSGLDILELSLGTVPSARQGGLGRYGFSGSCDPETTTFVTCSTVQVLLGKPGRVLVIGTVLGSDELDSDKFAGQCRIGSSRGPVIASADTIEGYDAESWGGGSGDGEYQSLTAIAVTDVFPSGSHTFSVECNQGDIGAIEYPRARVVAVALSDG